MLAVAVPAPLRPTLLAVDSCTRQHANLLVPGQIIYGLVFVSPLVLRYVVARFLLSLTVSSRPSRLTAAARASSRASCPCWTSFSRDVAPVP
jgi:hypothetical protein